MTRMMAAWISTSPGGTDQLAAGWLELPAVLKGMCHGPSLAEASRLWDADRCQRLTPEPSAEAEARFGSVC
jgi:hypothetical protein